MLFKSVKVMENTNDKEKTETLAGWKGWQLNAVWDLDQKKKSKIIEEKKKSVS